MPIICGGGRNTKSPRSRKRVLPQFAWSPKMDPAQVCCINNGANIMCILKGGSTRHSNTLEPQYDRLICVYVCSTWLIFLAREAVEAFASTRMIRKCRITASFPYVPSIWMNRSIRSLRLHNWGYCGMVVPSVSWCFLGNIQWSVHLFRSEETLAWAQRAQPQVEHGGATSARCGSNNAINIH